MGRQQQREKGKKKEGKSVDDWCSVFEGREVPGQLEDRRVVVLLQRVHCVEFAATHEIDCDAFASVPRASADAV